MKNILKLGIVVIASLAIGYSAGTKNQTSKHVEFEYRSPYWSNAHINGVIVARCEMMYDADELKALIEQECLCSYGTDIASWKKQK